MAGGVSEEELKWLDDELVRLGRGAAAIRLRAGEALEALASRRGHEELGFASVEAYVRERGERSGRWAADSRALARRLAALPRTRAALRSGAIGWSMAELLARHLTPGTEWSWLERARRSTVREMRDLLEGETSEGSDEDAEEPMRVLTVTATREDAWLFECAQSVTKQLGETASADGVLRALLAEGFSSLVERSPEARDELVGFEALEKELSQRREDHAAWCAELERRRTRASGESAPLDLRHEVLLESEPELPQSPAGLDGELRRLCAELTERDLVLGVLAERAHRAGLWRRLGFVNESHYARERVGLSLSSLKAKRSLAARTARLPELASAISSRKLGYESAYLLSRVATPRTVQAWVERAQGRTLKHLHEEVDAAELFVRFGYGRHQEPPDEDTLRSLAEIERRVATGDLLKDSGGQKSGGASRADGARVSRSERALGRVTFRFRVSAATARYFRVLERVYTQVSPFVCTREASFLGFLCDNFCRTWLPVIRKSRQTASGAELAYADVYRRDVFRCTSPVCSRRDVTPHHLKFRSAGGSDDTENVTTLCVWCHLHGVHGGRLSVEPPASNMRWRIGRNATLTVQGRQRFAA